MMHKKTQVDLINDLPNYRKLNRVLLEGKTPWTKNITIKTPTLEYDGKVKVITIDLWQIWGILNIKIHDPIDVERHYKTGVFKASEHYYINDLLDKIRAHFRVGDITWANKENIIRNYLEQKIDH